MTERSVRFTESFFDRVPAILVYVAVDERDVEVFDISIAFH